MRYTNQRLSPAKIQRTPRNIQCRDYINYKVKTQQTYMHYNNALYMGDMISYKRSGIGIIVTDEGTSAIVESCYDSITGHNIFFRENTIASMLHFKTGSYQIAIRTQHYILKLPFHDEKVCGSGVLLDFKENKIYHLVFHQGKLLKKILQTNKDVIFRVNSLHFKDVLNYKHEETFKLNLKYSNGIQVIRRGQKLHIGYFDTYGNFEGVGFKMNINQNSFDKFEEDLELRTYQRGFYNKNRLQNYGERYFPNGNLYIGQFQNDLFNGKGVLLYPSQIKGKWVCGDFQNNKLVKMLDMCLPETQNPKFPLKTILKGIHQVNSRNWMSMKIDLIDWNVLFNQLDEVINFAVTDIVIQKERQQREQEQRLQLIQRHFSDEYQGNQINQIILTQKTINSMPPEKIIVGQYSSIKTRQLNIEPRCIQNEELWSTLKTPKAETSKGQNGQKRFNLKLFTQSLEKSDNKNYSTKAYTPKPVSPGRGFKYDKKIKY